MGEFMMICVAVSLAFFISGVVCGLFACVLITYYDCPRSRTSNLHCESSMTQIISNNNVTPAGTIPSKNDIPSNNDIQGNNGYLGAPHHRPVQFRFV